MEILKSLKAVDQWILWRSAVRDGKSTKIPCFGDGRMAAVTDPASWLSHEAALEALKEGEGRLSGIGFCFTPDDPFFGVDLDGCLPRLQHDARAILENIDTYCEVSPSGKGLKLIGVGSKGDNPRSRTREVRGFDQLEVYDRDRFFTVTESPFGLWTDAQPCPHGLRWLLETFLPPPAQKEHSGEAVDTLEADDAEVLELMFSFANGEAARRLWGGNLDAYGGDHSAADLALVSYIAFVVGPDPDRIAELFEQSALGQREKWGRADYRKRTIDKVLGELDEFYKPPAISKMDFSDFLLEPEEGGVEETPQAHGVSAPENGSPSTGSSEEGESGDNGVRVTSSSPALSFPIPERGLIRDIVDLLGPETESPDETLALATLVMLSAAVGWQRKLVWGLSEEPCIIFAVICGPSAKGKKTTGMKTIETLFKQADIPLSIETAGHASGRALVETAMGGAELFYVKEPVVDALDPVERLEQEAARDKWEADRQEKLENPPPVVLVWDEFAKMLDVGHDWQRDTRAQLLQMYNGRHSGIRTSGKNGITVPGGRACLALIGTMTDEDLNRSLDVSQATDGLLGRILFSPPGAGKPPLPRPPARGASYIAREARVVEDLKRFYEFAHADVLDAYAGWTKDAERAWDEWYTASYHRTQGLENLLFSRGQATAVKIACILAMAEDVEYGQVQRSHIEQAIAILEASVGTSLAAAEAHIASQRDRYTDALVGKIIMHGRTPVSKVLEWGMLHAKEPGERMPDRKIRLTWVDEDPRLRIVKGDNGKGHAVELSK